MYGREGWGVRIRGREGGREGSLTIVGTNFLNVSLPYVISVPLSRRVTDESLQSSTQLHLVFCVWVGEGGTVTVSSIQASDAVSDFHFIFTASLFGIDTVGEYVH